MDSLAAWLKTKGSSRREAARQAASRLLSASSENVLRNVPIDLHALATCLGVEIEHVHKLAGEAEIVPARGGFRMLVSRQMGEARYRLTLAHELAHILFYSRDSQTPKRPAILTDAEERFCFDVARLVVVPEEHWESRGIPRMRDQEEVFLTLTKEFLVSRHVAARLMLQDYACAEGVAGRWVQESGDWVVCKGSGCASQSLGRDKRKALHGMARRWLACGAEPEPPCRIFGELEQRGKAVFLFAVADQRNVGARTPAFPSPGCPRDDQLTLF